MRTNVETTQIMNVHQQTIIAFYVRTFHIGEQQKKVEGNSDKELTAPAYLSERGGCWFHEWKKTKTFDTRRKAWKIRSIKNCWCKSFILMVDTWYHTHSEANLQIPTDICQALPLGVLSCDCECVTPRRNTYISECVCVCEKMYQTIARVSINLIWN